jgi:basic membrane protein A
VSSLVARAVLALAALAVAPSAAAPPLKVGVVTDIVALNSRPVVRQIVAGARRAEKDLGAEVRVVARKPNGSYLPSVVLLGRARFDVVVGFSFAQADAIDAAAAAFPRTKFVLLDYPSTGLAHRHGNVLGIVFREQEAGYLAGYLAALEERRRPGRDVIGSIGAYPNPPISRLIAGYQAGARKADPGITLLNAFSLNYVDRAACHSLALSQIARGSGVVLAASGDCGLGALAAAKAKGAWGIGSDVDESQLGAFVLTSTIKSTDTAVFDAIRSVRRGTFRGGDLSLGLRQGAVGLGRISPRVPASFVRPIAAIRAQIEAGRIRHIPTYPLVP